MPGESRNAASFSLSAEKVILTINGGSSSIKFAVFEPADVPKRLLSGQVERVGQPGTALTASASETGFSAKIPLDASDHGQAVERLIDWLKTTIGKTPIQSIGHRIVHGGLHLVEHQRVTSLVIDELKRARLLDLTHLPDEIALIEAFQKQFPDVPQVVCFDTAFHRYMPPVAQLLPIPRKYSNAGLRRFGFHGLSYAYLREELRRVAGHDAANGRVILAHLGSGASMAAVRGGQPMDTTMAFTPLAGLVMGTRPGDLDPGLLVYMMRVEKLTLDQIDDFLNHECGLKGVSETSSDMRDLSAKRLVDGRAALAVDLFCYRARQWLGALAASMGGLDTLVFAGGIGEHAPDVRDQICQGLEFLGIRIDATRNQSNAALISSDKSAVAVRVIATDEEIMIARTVLRVGAA